MQDFLTKFRWPIEVRGLNTPQGVISGYYDNIGKLYADIDIKPYDWYFVFNPIKNCEANNELVPYVAKTTSDNEIETIDWLFIDCDPIRASGSSATHEQHLAALAFADVVVKSLGWGLPLRVDSGNGCHLYYPIKQENTDDNTQLRAAVLTGLAERFDTSVVHIDRSVFNAARIARLPGTTNRKGEVHRLCRVIDLPNRYLAVTNEMLERVAMSSSYIKHDNDLSPEDVERGILYMEDFIASNKLSVREHRSWKEGHKWLLDECPFCGHSDNVPILTVGGNGAKGFKCSHDSCVDKHWAEFKALYEGKAVDLFPPKHIGDALHIFDPGFADLCKREWLIEDFLPRGTSMVLAGDAKTGKSTIICGIANCVLRGLPWLGGKTKRVPFVTSGLGVWADIHLQYL